MIRVKEVHGSGFRNRNRKILRSKEKASNKGGALHLRTRTAKKKIVLHHQANRTGKSEKKLQTPTSDKGSQGWPVR